MTKVTRLTLDDEGGLDRRRIHLREISGDPDMPLETVGQDLRAARLRRGDDLASVSRVLKIRKDHLEALEEDRMEALPGRTYAVGFVRSYSDYLGLDAVQCVERFKAEIAGRSDETAPAITVIDEDEHRRMPQGWKIIAGVILLLVVYGAYRLAIEADRMLSEPITAPPSQQTMVAAPKPVVTQPPKPAPVQQATIQPQAGPTDTVVESPPAGQLAPSNSSSQLQPSGVSTGATPDEPIPQGQTYGEQNRNSRVVLHVRQTTRILVQGPDRTVYINRTLKPGDSYRVPNFVGVTLTTSNAGAVQLELDGQAMGLVGKSDQTTEALSLDPQAISDRYNSGRSGG